MSASPQQTGSPIQDVKEEEETAEVDLDLDLELEEKESGSQSGSPIPVDEDHVCQICEEKFKQPRLLSCLHEFCTSCLEKQLEEEVEGALEQVGQPDKNCIRCPICTQDTKLEPGKGVSGLPVDTVLLGMLDMKAMEEMSIVCTSCKARDKAVARCCDCANFLCPNCVTAHQYMRCFENHKVLTFEELQEQGEGLALHKPVFCETHSAENLKFFCNTCQVPVCSECVLADHKQPDHHYERISDIETQQMEELKALVVESKSKVEFCSQASATLDSALQDLELQRDNARGLIQETFQSYKVMLEKQKEDVLEELSEAYSTQRESIWEMAHNVEKITNRVEDSCKFSDRVLTQGSSAEILTMKRHIANQLLTLINNTPKPEVNVKMEFISDSNKFQEAIKVAFGKLGKGSDDEEEAQGTQKVDLDMCGTSSLVSLEGDPFSLQGMLGPDASVLPPVSVPDFLPGMSSLPPLSLTGLPPLSGTVSCVAAESINSMASSMPSLNSDRCSSRNSYSPAMSDSGISVDAGSSSSTSNPSLVNLAGLAKLGSVNVNAQGQITLNGQVIPGLNVNNVTGLQQALTTRVSTPTPIQPSDAGLANILNSMNLSAGPRTPTTPQLGGLSDITSLLNAAGNQLNSLAGLGTGGPSMLTPPLPTAGLGSSLNGSLSPLTPPPPSPFPTSSGGMPSFPSPNFTPTVQRNNKVSPMQIRCKFGQLGPGKGQFNSPHGFCLGMDQDIVVADTNNHRIQVFEKTGEFKYQFGIPGREEGQLFYPRKVAVIRHSGRYVVCDRGNERSRMQIFTKSGHFIKKIAIRYIDIVAGLAITSQGHIVAVDSVSPTVFCIAESGDLIKWFDCSDYMREPSDIAVSGKEYFVCDFKGHCVVVFNEDGQFLRRIGCENITNFPNGIDISDAGDVLVGDSHGNRFHVAVFQRDGSLIGEFECPYVKVSRCCGLKITSEGYVVTLAKNNHHVLILNTLYIT